MDLEKSVQHLVLTPEVNPEEKIVATFVDRAFDASSAHDHALIRATASTLLNESGRLSPDAIERALAHQDPDAVRRAYAWGTFWKERVEMAQWWADHLDTLRQVGEVVPIRRQA